MAGHFKGGFDDKSIMYPFSPNPRTANMISLILAPGIATWIFKSQAGVFLHSGKGATHEFEKEYEAYSFKCFPREGVLKPSFPFELLQLF